MSTFPSASLLQTKHMSVFSIICLPGHCNPLKGRASESCMQQRKRPGHWRVTNLNIPLTNRVKSDIVISLSKNLQKRGLHGHPFIVVYWSRAHLWSLACLVFSGSHLPSSWAEAGWFLKIELMLVGKHAKKPMQFAVWFPEKDSKQIKLDCRQTKPTVLLLIRVNQPVVCCIQQHQADVLALSIVKHHPEAFIYESLHCKMIFSYLIKHSLAAWRCSNARFSTTPSSSHQQLAGSPPHWAARVHWCFFSDLFFGTHPSAVIFLSLGPGVVPLLLSKLGLGGPGTWWCRMLQRMIHAKHAQAIGIKVWRLEISMPKSHPQTLPLQAKGEHIFGSSISW